MCLNPIYIPNNAYRAVNKPNGKYITLSQLIDKDAYAYLQCSCGHCAECASLKQSYLSQRAQLMSKTHLVFFQTLTIQPKFMKTIEVNGVYNRYFDITYFQNYIKHLRKNDVFHGDFKFLAVTEYGGLRHRPHMHVLYFVRKDSSFWQNIISRYSHSAALRNAAIVSEARTLFWRCLHYWRFNHGSRKFPDYEPLLKFVNKNGRRNYDFQYVEEKLNANNLCNVTHYVTKYVLKYDPWIERKQQAFKLNLEPDEYKKVWNLVRPRVLISKHFGDDPQFAEYVRSSIDFSLDVCSQKLLFKNTYTGKMEPLAPYLRKKFVTVNQSFEQFYKHKQDFDLYKSLSFEDRRNKMISHFDKAFSMIRHRNESPDDFLYEYRIFDQLFDET